MDYRLSFRIYKNLLLIVMLLIQSVLSKRHTPCRIQCEICSSVERSASNIKPLPIALRLFDVVYTGVFTVFYANL